MKNISRLLAILVLCFLVSCGSSNIKTEKFTDKDFSSFKTFAYLPNTAFKASEFKSDTDESIEASIISTMNAKMIEKGFAVSRENPDLLVLLTTSNEYSSNKNRSETEIAQDRAGSSGGGPNYASVSASEGKRYVDAGGEALANIPLKSGTLIVEVFDSKSKQLVWLGTAENFKAHISDQTLMTRMVNEILDKFPN